MPLAPVLKKFHAGGGRNKWPKPPTGLTLEGPRILLRIGQPRDWRDWRDLREQSADFLKPWEPTWPPEALTFAYYSDNLRRQWQEWKDGSAYAFLAFLKETKNDPFDQFGQRLLPESGSFSAQRLIGGVSLTGIERGAFQKARLGYWIGKPYARRGLMTEATRLVLTFAFETLSLHRLEASCMEDNEPSKALLARLGFEKEGLAKAYLKINGAWEDHLLWGKTRAEG